MPATETPAFIVKLRNLWPKAIWNDDLLTLFVDCLKNYDAAIVSAAIARHCLQSRRNNPVLADIVDIAKAIASDQKRASRGPNYSSRPHHLSPDDEFRLKTEAKFNDARALDTIESWPQSERDRWLAIVKDTCGAMLGDLNAAGEPSEWTPMLRGLVLAAKEYADQPPLNAALEARRDLNLRLEGPHSHTAVRIHWLRARQNIMRGDRAPGTIPDLHNWHACSRKYTEETGNTVFELPAQTDRRREIREVADAIRAKRFAKAPV